MQPVLSQALCSPWYNLSSVSLHFLTKKVQKLNYLFLIISACALADQNVFI